MSVSLLIKYRNPEKKPRLVPIATEQVFEKYWQPASSKLGLDWVPLFQSGFPLRREDIPLIVAELTQLKNFISQKTQHDIPQDVARQVISRIENLLRELADIQEDQEAEGYIS